jgi:hypothetical protein
MYDYKKYQKEYREIHKDILKIRAKKRYLKNKEKILKKKKEYYIKNRDFLCKQKRDYRESLTEEQKLKSYEYQKKYHKENKQCISNRNREYQREQLKNNIQFRLRLNLRRRILAALDENWKSGHTLELLGCSVDFLRKHLESQFKDGMTWDNYGIKGWHIDHIKPCASFDLTDYRQQEQCFHYTNLQPLWWIDNIRKSDKI